MLFSMPPWEAQHMTKINLDISKPNRILDAQVRVISVEEAHLGVLELDTEQGFIPLSINRKVAYLLIAALAEFMAAKEVDEPPSYPANDAT
jgi:hypothetical protein